MRVVREIHHGDCKITIFSWNNRYIIKLEQGFFEQTFKINAFDLTTEADLDRIVKDESFIEECQNRFTEMGRSLYKTLEKL